MTRSPRRQSPGTARSASSKSKPTPAAPAHGFQDKSRGERLQKVLAEAGVGSRRACEELIEQGLVTVNGQLVATLPAWVNPNKDRIIVDGQRIRPAEALVYLMLYKPRGTVTTNRDPEGRTRAIDLVDHPLKPRLYPVGRLDIDSSGLLLLTNDGELANRLTHPRYGVHKTYEVTVRGSLDSSDVERLEEGIYLHDRRAGHGSKTRPVRLQLLKRDRERTLLRMELREGRNRQIRRMMLGLGHPVKKLRRIQMGPLKLKGLSIGSWRSLTQVEVQMLKKAAWEKDRKDAAEEKRVQSAARKRAEAPPSVSTGAEAD